MKLHCAWRYALLAGLWFFQLSPLFATPASEEIVAAPNARIKPAEIDVGPVSLAELGLIMPLHSEFHGWPPTASEQPFGYEATERLKGGLQDKWQAVKNRLPGERLILARCRIDAATCPPAAKLFLKLIDEAIKRDGIARIAEINRAINLTIRPADDMAVYGVEDLWATPLTTFTHRAGDCEDYAIAKYVALQEMGFAIDQLRIVIVKDERGQGHAMTAVRDQERWLILDNRYLGIQEDVVTAESAPVFIIDNGGASRLAAIIHKPKIWREPSPMASMLVFLSGWQPLPVRL